MHFVTPDLPWHPQVKAGRRQYANLDQTVIFFLSNILIHIDCEASSMRDNLSVRSLTSMLSFHNLLKHIHTFGSKYSMKAQEVLFVCTPIIAAKALTSP